MTVLWSYNDRGIDLEIDRWTNSLVDPIVICMHRAMYRYRDKMRHLVVVTIIVSLTLL